MGGSCQDSALFKAICGAAIKFVGMKSAPFSRESNALYDGIRARSHLLQ
ncbi:MAG: hypothetical protein ACI841_004206 [Planctomycetota bacterium]|jgi:hypothetical protein